MVKQNSSEIAAIIFDCGVGDRFIETNRQPHSELSKLKIPDDYTERNGAHKWPY